MEFTLVIDTKQADTDIDSVQIYTLC